MIETVTREEEKQQTKELVEALMTVDSNKPKCRNCGERFKPSTEEIQVELPDEDVMGASRTSYVEKPDYCSKECKVANAL